MGPSSFVSIAGNLDSPKRSFLGMTLVILHIPWIFGSFLATTCALTSCHIWISKQDSTIRAVGYNRWVTGRRPRDENHAVRFRPSAENRSRAWDTQSIRGVSDELARGCKRWHPTSSWRKIWEEKVLTLRYVSPSISQLTTSCGLFRE